MRIPALVMGVVLAASAPLSAQRAALPLPPVAGMALVQTLTMKEGDRESVHTVQEVTAKGLRWVWSLVEVQPAGDTVRRAYKYAELNADVADAIRFRIFHDSRAPEEHPGYTMHSVSRAVYRRLRAEGSDSFQVMAVESSGPGLLGMGGAVAPVRWTGRLTLATKGTVPFPLLVNGKRVEVPALHIRGRLAARGNTWEPELWVMADSTYPLLLKWVGAHRQAGNVLQTIRVDLPTAGATGSMEGELEGGLSSSGCRAELPGIYFGFNRADLDGASDRALAAVAGVLKKHPGWAITLEGHTDSIGGVAANRALSERRVEAVRARLVSTHQVEGARLKTVGYGSARPREPNATIEGRARNRRVELVRECSR
jgi:outer membrane protein OmpA-like peptidoglycan-associated protein